MTRHPVRRGVQCYCDKGDGWYNPGLSVPAKP